MPENAVAPGRHSVLLACVKCLREAIILEGRREAKNALLKLREN